MSSTSTIQLLSAEAQYYRERLALLRAKAYRGGATSSSRMLELERGLASAERRLAEARHRGVR